MSEPLTHRAFFGDADRAFKLTADLVLELERKTGVGIFTLCRRVFASDCHHADVTETIRLALIGGGETPEAAASLVHVYAVGRPLSEAYELAVAILETLWFGSRQSIAQTAPVETRAAETREYTDGETRFSPPNEAGEIEGLAVRFNVIDGYRTSFDPAAFAGIEGRSIPLLWSHDRAEVIGSGTVRADAEGLRIRAKLNLDVQRAKEVRSMLTAGDINGLSIGFRRIADEARPNGTRHITKALLDEVSVVALPSVPGSAVTSVRASPALADLTAAIRSTATALKG